MKIDFYYSEIYTFMKIKSILRRFIENFLYNVKQVGEVRLIFHEEKTTYKIGDYSYGKIHVLSYQENGHISIGKYSSISEITIIMGGNHHTGLTTFPMLVKYKNAPVKDDNKPIKDVIIGNDVWIGYNAIILEGVTIGDGAIIGAGALISKDVPPYSIMVGNPAKQIRKRFDENQIAEIQKTNWWEKKPKELLKIIDSLYGSNVEKFIEDLVRYDKIIEKGS